MMKKLTGKLHGTAHLSGELSGCSALNGTISRPKVAPAEEYRGPYEFTPEAEAQVIEINQRQAKQDIIIGAIPSNYGLVTWNGSVLTVS